MTLFRLLVLVPALLLFALGPTGAQATQTTAQIQSQYENLRDFQADFVQELKNVSSGETEKRTGRILYKSPNLVHWETVSPEKELLILGTDYAWDYFAGEGTVYKYRISDIMSSKTMLKFISGKARLDEDFQVAEEGQETGAIKLRLTPKEPEPNLVQATVWVDPQTWLLTRINILDFYGNSNTLSLNNVQLNPGLFPSLFKFTPPAGTRVQDNTK
jgi:outer membrane lipoprotein carrier protein